MNFSQTSNQKSKSTPQKPIQAHKNQSQEKGGAGRVSGSKSAKPQANAPSSQSQQEPVSPQFKQIIQNLDSSSKKLKGKSG